MQVRAFERYTPLMKWIYQELIKSDQNIVPKIRNGPYPFNEMQGLIDNI